MSLRKFAEDDNIEPKEIKPYFMAFNSMDRAVKHGNGYTIGLAMHSERTAAFESINDENHNAYHTLGRYAIYI